MSERNFKWLVTGLFGAVMAAPFLFYAMLAYADRAPSEAPYVILLRHGDAPGRNEPPDFTLSNCRTQRNLSDKGRDDARELGAELRKQDIPITRIAASRWCRTLETAKLLQFGKVTQEQAFDNIDFSKERSSEIIESELRLISSWRGPGVLLVVTHSSNIKKLSGFELAPGAMVIARRTPSGTIAFRMNKIAYKGSE